MKYFCLIFVAAGLMNAADVSPAAAQNVAQTPAVDPFAYRETYFYNPLFDKMVVETQKKPRTFNFFQFRQYYGGTSQYDPIGETVLNEMNELAFIAMRDKDAARRDAALFGYKTLVEDHLAHINVVLHALSMARRHERFGDVAILSWVRDGLIWAILHDGHGNSLARGFNIFTLPEEEILLSRLGVKVLKTDAVLQGNLYYNIHHVVVNKTGQRRAVFVKNSVPMKYLAAEKVYREQNLSVDIRKN